MKNFERSANIHQEIQDHILDLEIDRRDKKNALTHSMYQTLSMAFQEAQNKPDIYVVHLHGQEDLFTAGNDLKDFIQLDLSAGSSAVDFLEVIAQFTKPIIASVGGPAIGIGTTLLLHCDLVVSSDEAVFQMPFVNLGVCPEGGSSFMLQQIAGHKLSNELLLLAEPFNSQVALQAGLVNHVYPAKEMLELGLELCKKIASKPQDSIRTTKALLKMHQQDKIQQVIHDEFEQFVSLIQRPVAKEIMTAILEKRAPNLSQFKST